VTTTDLIVMAALIIDGVAIGISLCTIWDTRVNNKVRDYEKEQYRQFADVAARCAARDPRDGSDG
jgi:hypothetical protein